MRHSVLIAILGWVPSIVGSQTIRIEPPVQVSPPDSGGHVWGMGNTHAAPDDPLSLITCGIRERSNPLSWEGYLYASADGGLTWRAARIDTTPSDAGVPNQVSETSCALGRHGTMYMNTSVWGRFYSRPFQLSHSTDGGHTWSVPLQRAGWYDATRSIVDNSAGPFDGHLYIFSNRVNEGPVVKYNRLYQPLLVSMDGGHSLDAAIADRPDERYSVAGWPSQAVVLNDGKVVAAHIVQFGTSRDKGQSPFSEQAYTQFGVDVVGSSDGGRSLDSPITVGRWRRNQKPENRRVA